MIDVSLHFYFLVHTVAYCVHTHIHTCTHIRSHTPHAHRKKEMEDDGSVKFTLPCITHWAL